MKPEELSNWFLCPDVKEAVGSWVFLQVTFTGSVVLCGRFVVGGSLWEPLDVRCAQHLRIHLALAHVFQTLLDGSGQVHVGLVDAGSFDDSKARHHLNHLHTGFPVTKKKKSGLFTWRLIDVWKKKKEKKENLMRWGKKKTLAALTMSGPPCREPLALSPPEDRGTVSLHRPPTCSCWRHGPGPRSSRLWC